MVGQPRFFKDAAKGDPQGIAFDTGDSFEQFLVTLIDTPAMARMGTILQLGGKSTLIGAEHTRRDHMIHAAYLARHAVKQLKIAMDRVDPRLFDPRMGMACVVACLLHDIGHAPYSHEFENIARELGNKHFHHEEWGARMIREESVIQSCFTQFYKDHPECGSSFLETFGMNFDDMVIALIEGKAPQQLAAYQSIVSGKIDCDRNSFLLMDRAQCADVDLLTSLPPDMWSDIEIGSVNGTNVIVHSKENAEKFLLVWLEQYEKIYYAPNSDSKQSLLEPILRAFMEKAPERTDLTDQEKALYQVLSGSAKATVKDYLKLSDGVIDGIVRRMAEGADGPAAQRMAQRFLDDDLLPTLDLSFLGSEHHHGLQEYLTQHLPDSAVLGQDIFITNAKQRDIRKVSKHPHNVAYVRNERGEVVPVQEASYLISKIETLNAFYVHAEKDVLLGLIPLINTYLTMAEHVDQLDRRHIINHAAVRKTRAPSVDPRGLDR